MLLLLGWLLPLPRSAPAAQIFEDLSIPSPVLEFDPSMRSTAMGGASGAVFWGDPNHWANPALLGFVDGIHYDDAIIDFGTFSFSSLGFEEEFRFRETARRETVGYGGFGISLAGRPFDGPGGMRLDFGDIYDQARSWSTGISLARVTETVLRRSPAIARHFDLALGYTHKTLDEAPGVLDTHATLWDWGLLARGGTDFTVRGVPARIEGAYGYSFLNRTGDPYPKGNQHQINSAGLHVAAARLPEGFVGLPSWLRSGFEPLVSIGGDFDADDEPGRSDHSERWGGELALANVLFLRLGRSAGELSTHGFGIGLPVGSFGGVRYDQADRESGFGDVKFRAWSVWVDPLAILRARR